MGWSAERFCVVDPRVSEDRTAMGACAERRRGALAVDLLLLTGEAPEVIEPEPDGHLGHRLGALKKRVGGTSYSSVNAARSRRSETCAPRQSSLIDGTR